VRGWWDRLKVPLFPQAAGRSVPLDKPVLERYISILKRSRSIIPFEWNIYGIPAVFMLMPLFNLVAYNTVPLYPVRILGLEIVLILWITSFLLLSARYKKYISSLLAQSALAERISSGLLDNDPIYRYTAWPWRLWLPQPSLSRYGFEEWHVLRLVQNLDWYLKKSRNHFRWRWVLQPLFALIGLAFIAAPMLLHQDELTADPISYWAATLSGCTFWIGLLMLWILVVSAAALQYERCVWRYELLNYLREHNAKQ